MENSGEDLSSSTANHSFSGDGRAAESNESGWTSYIDYFMETQRRQKAKGESSLSAEALSTDDVGGCRPTSENSVDCGVGASTRLPALLEPSAVSKRLSLKEAWGRRKKKVLYDDSLEDTATSPISSPKKNTTGDVNGANTTTDTTITEDGACDNNELMKKGLCLVPLSTFRV